VSGLKKVIPRYHTTYKIEEIEKAGRRERRVGMSSNTADEVFQYTGSETVPKDVTIVHFHCNVVNLKILTFRECTKLKEVVLNINNGLQTIGSLAFSNCTLLESITLPSTVTEIGAHAFRNCNSLRELVLNEGLEMIGTQAFYGCSLNSISIPSSDIEIGEGAFQYCTDLREIVLNEGLKKMGRCVLHDCSSLESITLPSTVTDIDQQAFDSCIGLREMVLNEGLEKIGHFVFYKCSSLQSITLPSSLVEIGAEAFRECINLREVVCSGELPKVEYNTFNHCPVLERITFPNLSSRLEDIIQAGQVDIQEKVQQWCNQGETIEWRRGGEMYIPVEVTRRRDSWKGMKQRVDQIITVIKYYEMKEATTIFELALWKAKIDQVEDDIYQHDRDACRIEVPGPVKDTILQYLDVAKLLIVGRKANNHTYDLI